MSTFRVCFQDKGGKSHQQLLKPGRLYAKRVCFNQSIQYMFVLIVRPDHNSKRGLCLCLNAVLAYMCLGN